MNYTHRFGLTTLDKITDRIEANGSKFGVADRILLDRLLQYAVEHHVHTGEVLATTPPAAPTLTLSTFGGTLRPNATLYYKYALVDERGQGELASQVGMIVTPNQISPPAAPTITAQPTGGLVGGSYLYAVSAYTGTITQETPLSTPVSGLLEGNGGTWRVVPPVIPSGASGFNLYRRGPNEDELVYLTSITPGSTYFDSGTDQANARHLAPTSNTTFSTNSVMIEPPDLPDDYTYRIFRTYDITKWDRSYVDWASTETFTDTGHATRDGVPPSTSSGVGGAPKINLTDAGDIDVDIDAGLPPGMITSPATATFSFTGPVEPGYGNWMWINEFERCDLVSMRGTLGLGSTPAAQAIYLTLERRAPDGDWGPTTAFPASIAIGDTIGDLFVYDYDFGTGTLPLVPGEALRPLILISGGGATPTDFDLTITVTMLVSHGSTTQSYIWETT